MSEVGWTVTLIGGRHRHMHTRVHYLPFVGIEILRPIAFRCGIYLERYAPDFVDFEIHHMTATYVGLGRSGPSLYPIGRRPPLNPARLV